MKPETIFQQIIDANNDAVQAQAKINEAKAQKASAEITLTEGRSLLAAVDSMEADPNVQASLANNPATASAFALVAGAARAVKPDLDNLDATLQAIAI